MFGEVVAASSAGQQRGEEEPDGCRQPNEQSPTREGRTEDHPAARQWQGTLSMQNGSPTHIRLLGASRIHARYVSNYTFTSLSVRSGEYIAFYSSCADSRLSDSRIING